MQLTALKTPRKTCPGKADKNSQENVILGQKIFILGQKLTENFYPRTNFSENFYPKTKFPENFYPRMKIFRKLFEIFCSMWGRKNFIWVGQNFKKIIVLYRTTFFRKFLF